MKKLKRKIPDLERRKVRPLNLILSTVIMSLYFGIMSLAGSFPDPGELTCEGAVCFDCDTETVIYGKNEHEKYSPASVTKVLTALTVLDYAQPDQEISFSHDDVYNVDSGSSNAQIDEGDVLTVEDCLYALLYKSANEAANALARNIAGSREAFAELMNEKAKSLGCLNSHFTNPSGLYDPDHYTTAYDMALVALEALKSEEFMKIEGTRSYTLPPTRRNPSGLTIYMEHKMLLKNTRYSDSRAIAGKTGYTVDSGNTLLTIAEENGRHIAVVVLKDKNPQHYQDTKKLFDMAFNETENVNALLYLDPEDIKEDLKEKNLWDGEADIFIPDEIKATVSKGDTLSFSTEACDEGMLLAKININSENGRVGSGYAEKYQSVGIVQTSEDETEENQSMDPYRLIMIVCLPSVLIILLIFGYCLYSKRKNEMERRENFRKRRLRRLEEDGITEEDIKELLNQKRNIRLQKQKAEEKIK